MTGVARATFDGIRWSVAIVGALLLSVFFVVPVGAEPPPQVDVLLLVDQSGSMGGAAFGMPSSVVQTPNDPAGLRFAAPQAAFNILGIDRLALHRTAEYRLGVISFGGPTTPLQFRADYAQVTLDLTPIAPTDPREWEATQATIDPALSSDPWVRQRKNLGSTSFVEPFQLACEQFSKHVVTPSPKRLVILMTDGIPERSYETIDVSAHLGRVREIVRECDALRSAEIHVVGLTNFANLRYFDTVEELWWRVTGDKSRVGLIANNQQLHQKVAGIIAGVVPWGSRVSRKTAIGSHLDRVVFRVFKTATTDVVRFFPPGSKGPDDYLRCGAAVDCQGISALTQVVTVPFPRAGVWRVEVVSGRDVEVWKTEVPVDVSLDTPASLVQYGRARVGVRLLTQQGAEWTASLDPDVRVDWSGSSFVDGAGATPLVVTTEGDRYAFELVPGTAGPARVRLRGTAPGFDEDGAPRTVVVFDKELPVPTVVPGKLVRLRPTVTAEDGADPSDLHEWWSPGGALGRRAVRLVVEAVGSDGALVRPPDVFSGVPSIIATVSGPDGDEQVELPIGRDRWEATVALAMPGQYEVGFRTPTGSRPAIAVDDAPVVVVNRAEAPWRHWGIPMVVIGAVAALAIVGLTIRHQYLIRREPHLTGTLKVTVLAPEAVKGTEDLHFRSGTNTQKLRSGALPGLVFAASHVSATGRPTKTQQANVIRLVVTVPVVPDKAAVGATKAAARPGTVEIKRLQRGQYDRIVHRNVQVQIQFV